MIEQEANVKVGNLQITRIDRETGEELEIIPVPYMKRDVMAMLEVYLKRNKKIK